MFTKILTVITLVVALFGALNATSVAGEEEDCPKICPALLDPICATDGKIFKEFSNACDLSASNCHLQRSALKTYVTTLMDWCRTELIDDLDNLLVKLNNLDINKPECMKPCALIYQPVCVSNGVYRSLASNVCVMENVNCALGPQTSFKVIQNDTC